jgi:hypothetical protein
VGTIIHTSDGGKVGLSGEPDGIIASIAHALDQERSEDKLGQLTPRGFLPFTLPQGTQVWVNAAQIARIEKT